MTAYKSYILCTSPRSGSTLLCRLLRETGVAGWPGSHFHEPTLQGWCDDYGLKAGRDERATVQAVFEAARAKGTAGRGMFALRLQGQSLAHFCARLQQLQPDAASERDRFERQFGKTLFVYLNREDKLAQAVSYVKAQQSGLWHKASDGREIERLSPPQDPIYDADRIAQQLQLFQQMDQDWQQWFSEAGITPFHISYSALSRDPYQSLNQLLNELNLPEVPAGEPPVARLSDAVNQAWIERFLAEQPA